MRRGRGTGVMGGAWSSCAFRAVGGKCSSYEALNLKPGTLTRRLIAELQTTGWGIRCLNKKKRGGGYWNLSHLERVR